MKKEFKNGEMIITHESGIVDKYQGIDLEKQIALLERERNEAQQKIDHVNNDIQKIQSSIGEL